MNTLPKLSTLLMLVLSLQTNTIFAQQGDSDASDQTTVDAQELSEEEARAKSIADLEKLKQEIDEKKRKAEQEKLEKQQQEQQSSKPKEPRKVFKPTEEISEDSPVPFPVDL